ncbi:MAG: HAD family hydrolase [Pseudomonadota bacterium]
MTIEAVLFDKDGTLFGFDQTWGGWTLGVIEALSGGDADCTARLADALKFDPVKLQFDPASPVIAGTAEASAAVMLPYLKGWTLPALVHEINIRAMTVKPVPPVPLAAVLDALAPRVLGVATNDAEAPARQQLEAAGVADRFVFVAGYDSGFGAKPAPGMLLGFTQAVGIAPERIAMVGDSTHDLRAGRAAGMVTVGVLTGPAPAAELEPFADAVLPDIGALPGWLDR